MNFKILVIFFFFLLSSCDSQCFRTVKEVVKIINGTGRSLNLEVCNNAFSKKEIIEIPFNQDGDFLVNEREVFYMRSGLAARKCELVDGESFEVELSLTESSFSKVKLCYIDQEGVKSNIMLVEVFQNCPSGYLEQVSPNTDCLDSL